MIRVACLGAGYFSQFHIDGWQRIDDASLVGVADLDPAKTANLGIPAFATSKDMITSVQPDILDIILPPVAHADVIQEAIALGVKTIICQKPFCTSLKEAEAMVALAETSDVTLVIHENFRFQPWYRAIKASIAAGDIGLPRQATFRMRPGDGQGPDAYLERQPYFQTMPRFLVHETGVHWVDTFRYLFGDPLAVYADLRQVNPVIAGEDAGYILFDHPHGMRCILDANRCLDHAAQNTRCTMGEGLFEGETGTLTLQGDGSVHLRTFGQLQATEILGPSASNNFGGDCTYHLQAHVIAAIRDNFPLENTASAYLTVIRAEEAIYVSSESQRKVKLNNKWHLR